MTAFQKSVWFNTQLLDIYNDTSGFEHIQMIGNGDLRGQAITGEDGTTTMANCQVSVWKQLSAAKCQLDTDFGCFPTNNSMWVDHGCRAVFACNGVSSVDCESKNEGYVVCPCTTGPPQPALVMARPTSDSGAAVALHNPNNVPRNITVYFSDIPNRPFTNATSLEVRNVWTHVYEGDFVGYYTAKGVRAHQTVVITVAPQGIHARP